MISKEAQWIYSQPTHPIPEFEEMPLKKTGESQYGWIYSNDLFCVIFDKVDGHLSILLQWPALIIYSCDHNVDAFLKTEILREFA